MIGDPDPRGRNGHLSIIGPIIGLEDPSVGYGTILKYTPNTMISTYIELAFRYLSEVPQLLLCILLTHPLI